MSQMLDLGMTVEEMWAYCAEHMANGRRGSRLALDRRGLHFLTEKTDVHFCVPPDGKTHDDGRVFVRAVF